MREYAQAEVDMITAPAAFTVATGKAHWETLLRARAIETGAYVHRARTRRTSRRRTTTWGAVTIVDPWGEIIAKLDHDAPGYILADIDLSKLRKPARGFRLGGVTEHDPV